MPKRRKTFKEFKKWWDKTHKYKPSDLPFPTTYRDLYRVYNQQLDRQKRQRKSLKERRRRGEAPPKRRRISRR